MKTLKLYRFRIFERQKNIESFMSKINFGDYHFVEDPYNYFSKGGIKKV